MRPVRVKTHIVRQAERLQRGEINRRRFIMSALATGVTLPTATSLAQKAEAAQPKAGGLLRFGFGTPDRLAEVRALATGSTLLEIDTSGALTGDLARAYETPDKGLTWAFHLRRDVIFEDGQRFDAQAVVASLSMQDTPGLRGQISGMRADGPETLIIELIRPNADFAWVLTDPALTIKSPTGAGTGAYARSSDQRRLRKVSDHWKAGRGHFDAVELIDLPDPATRLSALLHGEIDLIDDIDPKMFGLLARSQDIKLIETEAASVFGLIRQPETSPDVGRAINDATDRRDLAQKVLLGHGRAQGCSNCTARTGVTTPLSLGQAQAFPGAREFVAVIEQMARAKGLAVRTTGTPDFKAERLRIRPTLDWTLAEVLARRPNAALQALLIQARATPSAEEKTALHRRALTYLEDHGDLYPLIANDIHAHSAALHLPSGPFDALRIVERGWFA
ncbi:MAG: hypothetical protein HKN27_17560 [Silicimonas sp.]|nr:hypothetical protein [Silicimonas sp.]